MSVDRDSAPPPGGAARSGDGGAIDPVGATEGAPAGADASELAPGATLGKYRLDRVLGAGGMGVVWGAFDPDLERPVALKVLRAADVTALRTRLLREARAMARLKHPNVVTVYEVGTDRNRDYIAMELVDGASLERWLADAPPRDAVIDALMAAGKGLAAAHDAGLVHRDFKPHNVLRSAVGHVFVTDFGLARGTLDDGGEVAIDAPSAVGALASGSAPLLSQLTQTGVLVGTPAYMAPEQFTGHAPEPRSDQFAFCVTAWEALAGSHPFRGAFAALRGATDARGQLGEMQAIVSGGAPAGAGLPPKVRAVLARGLAADPEARWPDMNALLLALSAAAAQPARRRGTRIALAAVIGGAATVAGILIAQQVGGGSTKSAAATCDAASAFGDAWSGERRTAVKRAHANNSAIMLGATEVIDKAAERWKSAYSAACKLPLGENREERLACLAEVKQEFDQTTQGLLEQDSDLDFAELVSLGTDVAPCER